jgi:hypothetical protein
MKQEQNRTRPFIDIVNVGAVFQRDKAVLKWKEILGDIEFQRWFSDNAPLILLLQNITQHYEVKHVLTRYAVC